MTLEMERAYVAKCVSPEAARCVESMRGLGSDDFEDYECSVVFGVARKLHNIGVNPGHAPEILFDALDQTGIGWRAWLTGPAIAAQETKVSAAGIEAEVIHRKACIRKAMREALAFAEHSKSVSPGDPDAFDELRRSSTSILSAFDRRGAASRAHELGDVARERVARIVRGEKVPLVSLGLPKEVEAAMGGGARRGTVCIVGSRPGGGKTTLGMHAMLTVARSGRRVLFASIEMTEEELADRALSTLSGIPLDVVEGRTRAPTLEEKETLTATAHELARLPMTIVTPSSPTIAEVRGMVYAECNLHPDEVGLVVVDYLQLIEGLPRQTLFESVSAASNGLRSLAKEVGVPFLVLHQLNREGAKPDADGKVPWPRMTDLKGSGDVEQDAHSILLLHRERDGAQLGITVAKARAGRAGGRWILSDADFSRFRLGGEAYPV